MSCADFHELFPGALYGDLAESQEESLRRHLDACPACREEWNRFRDVKSLLDQISVPASVTTPVNLSRLYFEAGLRKEVQIRRWRRTTLALAGAAAILLVFFTLNWEIRLEKHQLVLRWGNPPEEPVRPVALAPDPAPVVKPAAPEVSQADLQLLKDLIHALAQDAEGRDEQQQAMLLAVQTQVESLRRQTRALAGQMTALRENPSDHFEKE
jgi:hypothetical protein